MSKIRRFLLITVGLLIFIAYLVYSNPFKAFSEITDFKLSLFLIALFINHSGLFFFALSWYILLRALSIDVSAWRSIQVTFISLFLVWIIPIPVGTEILRAYLIRDEKENNLGKAIASVTVHKAYYNLAFGIMIGIGVFVVTILSGGNIPIRRELVYFVIIFAGISSIVFAAILHNPALKYIFNLLPDWIFDKIFKDLEMDEYGYPLIISEIGDAVTRLARYPYHNLLSFMLLAFKWSTGSIVAYLIALAFGNPINFWLIVLIYAVVEFIQQINFIIPGGLGVIDAGLTGAFILIGVPLSLVSAISLLTRLVTYWLELVLCAGVTFQYGYKKTMLDYLE
jgi:hypothetical protein